MELVSNYMRDDTLRHALNDLTKKTFGFYLFANLDAVDFYDKCGFSKETEYRYSIKNEFCMKKSAGEIFMPVNTGDKQMKQKYMDMVRRSAVNSSLEQLNKFGLQMFYTADMENIYYAKDMDCFIVADMEENTLLLQSIICEKTGNKNKPDAKDAELFLFGSSSASF